jgi:hypothetical protein
LERAEGLKKRRDQRQKIRPSVRSRTDHSEGSILEMDHEELGALGGSASSLRDSGEDLLRWLSEEEVRFRSGDRAMS